MSRIAAPRPPGRPPIPPDDDDEPEIEIIDGGDDDEPAEPDNLVAASEAELLTMARTLLAPALHDPWAVLCRARKLPDTIGPTCAQLLADTLAQTWPALWRRGGTAPRPTTAGKRARAWQQPPVALAFSAASLQLLRWLVATPLGAPASTLDRLGATPLTIGDQVLVYLAVDAAAPTPAITGLVRQPFVQNCPLVWLGFAHLFDAAPSDKLDFDALATGSGALVVEALGAEIARRWRSIELGKRAITSPPQLMALGAAQDGTLTRFMAACDRARRRDLAAWLIDAAAPELARNLAPLPSLLDPTTALWARTGARVAAGSLLRAIERWGAWDAEHRGVRFIDDDYALAQVLLARFEPIGSAGVERAQQWLGELASLAPTTAAAPNVDPATVEAPP